MKKCIVLLFLFTINFTVHSQCTGAFKDSITGKWSFDQNALENCLKNNFESYANNPREHVSLLGGGWVKMKYEPNTNFIFKTNKTSNELFPFEGMVIFSMKQLRTNFTKSKEEALKDNIFLFSDSCIHRHYYKFDAIKTQWIVVKRESDSHVDSWVNNCDEKILSGENKGETNIQGCWEENFINNPLRNSRFANITSLTDNLSNLNTSATTNKESSIEILHAVDKMTGKEYYSINKKLFYKKPDKAFLLRVFITDGKYEGIMVKSVNVGTCHENDKLYFLFSDASKLEMTAWNKFNCDGEANFDFNSSELGNLQKPLASIMIQNGRSYESMMVDVGPEDTNYFIDIYNAIIQKNFVSAHIEDGNIVKD
jgi:hypothetical protein